MKKLDVIAEQLFNQIRGRFPSVEIGDADGNVTSEPNMARFYEFDYETNGNSLGKVSISLDEENGVVVMYSQNFLENQYPSVKSQWFNFLKEIRMFAKKRLMKFEVRDITRSNLTKRDYKFLATNRPGEQTMAESKMYGTNKTSYQKIGNARIAIKHKSAINVENANNRTKHIGSIFIESPTGEKFKFPFKHLSGARAMARHVSEGGNAYDDFGKYISGLSEELSKLNKFKQYMNRSTVMAESLAGYMDTVNERIIDVRKTVQNLQKESFYKTAFESYEAPAEKTVPDDVAENWIDQLTIKQFNEELKDVFPYIYNLVSETTKAKDIIPEDLLGESEAYLTAYPGDTVADLVVRAQKELGIQTSADDIIEVNGLDDQQAFLTKTQVLVPQTSMAPSTSLRPQPRPTNIGAGGTSELGPNGQPTGSTRGIDPALNYNEAIDKIFDEMMGQFSERVSLDETSHGQGEAMLAKADMLLQGTGFTRQGFEIVKAPQQGMVRGSITDEALAMVKNMLAKAKAMGATEGPAINPNLTVNPADVDDSEFSERVVPGADPNINRLTGKPNQPALPGSPAPADGSFEKTQVNILNQMMPGVRNTETGEQYVLNNGIFRSPARYIVIPTNGNATTVADIPQQAAQLLDEGNAFSKALAKARANNDDEMEVDGKKIPVTEFILSYFDRETGQFPKGPTAVLTMVEKEYGEQYVRPAQKFIERIEQRVAEVMGYGEAEVGVAERRRSVVDPDYEPTQYTDAGSDYDEYANEFEELKALMAQTTFSGEQLMRRNQLMKKYGVRNTADDISRQEKDYFNKLNAKNAQRKAELDARNAQARAEHRREMMALAPEFFNADGTPNMAAYRAAGSPTPAEIRARKSSGDNGAEFRLPRQSRQQGNTGSTYDDAPLRALRTARESQDILKLAGLI